MLLTKQKIYSLIIKKQIKKNIDYFFKKGLLLVDKIKLIVAFRMSELVMYQKADFPIVTFELKKSR